MNLRLSLNCFGHVSFHRGNPPFAPKIHYVKKKKPVNVYNSSDFLTIKYCRRWYKLKSLNLLWHSSDSYNVGAGTLPFLFRWGNTTCALWCMFYADKPGRSEKSRDISWATRIGEKHAAPGFTVNTRVEHAQVVEAQQKQKGSLMAAYMLLRIGWVSQRIRRYLRLFHLRQYFKGRKIRRILKLYGRLLIFPTIKILPEVK